MTCLTFLKPPGAFQSHAWGGVNRFDIYLYISFFFNFAPLDPHLEQTAAGVVMFEGV